jgi:hypothetical protein
MPPKEEWILEELERTLEKLHHNTGIEGRLVPLDPGRLRRIPADALLEVRVGGRAHRYAVLAKTQVDRLSALWPLKERLDHLGHPGLLFAPRISDNIARKCRELDLPFIDAAGNVYLRGPGLYVFTTGQGLRGRARAGLTARGAGTATALRVVFAFLCRPELFRAPYRDIRDAAGVALGAVGHVFLDLQKRGYLVGAGRRRERRLVEPVRLFEEWVTNYPIKLRPKLHPRRFRAQDPGWWRTARLDGRNVRWGGEVAADRLTRYIKPAAVTLYVVPGRGPNPVAGLVAKHRLRADPEGNIEILDMFWDFPTEPTMPDVVPPILVYADLVLTLDPRNMEVARLIREKYIDRALGAI